MIRCFLFVFASLALASGCSSSSSSPSSPSNGTPVSIPAGASNLGASAYSPNPITVTAGTTVTWTNGDSTPHTATSDTAGIFDSGSIQPGGMFSTMLQTRGTVTYHCTLHAGMVGTIIVQ
ncbi:MAG TPA: plastocyanin/azurin family copper-binding protein [Vicinamibacterales bacterium]|jgi:plastocyanin|nr:plastocyanin/azurin family copper-binding protein [Vicinamibacterales bacterium]